MIRFLLMAAYFCFFCGTVIAQPLRIEVTEGVIETIPIALPNFIDGGGSNGLNRELRRIVSNDLLNSGLFKEIPQAAHLSRPQDINAPVEFKDWRAVKAQALLIGETSVQNGNILVVKYRLYDVISGRALGDGIQLTAPVAAARRLAHRVADAVYSRITGEGPYFDSRIAFIAESGPKGARVKRLAVMDYDGENIRYLTDGSDIVLSPRFSPNNREVIYTSYATGQPEIYIIDVETGARRKLRALPSMTFSPRFSPDGGHILFSQTFGSNTDIFRARARDGRPEQLTFTNAIETSASYSPDGRNIVFESDRSGSQQIYVMPATGGEARRISFGEGRYGTPVWSPRGDKIAFTKILKGQFHIGVMDVNGGNERLLTQSFLDESPSWSPNGRVLTFFRETRGENGAPSLYSVDITGLNLQKIPTPDFGSDPSWSGLLD